MVPCPTRSHLAASSLSAPAGRPSIRLNEPEKRVLGVAGSLVLIAAAIAQIAGETGGHPAKSIVVATATVIIGGSALIVITRTAPAMKKKFRISYLLASGLLVMAGAAAGTVGYLMGAAAEVGGGPQVTARAGGAASRWLLPPGPRNWRQEESRSTPGRALSRRRPRRPRRRRCRR